MSLSWITQTPSIENGVKLANLIDDIKFPLLLSRIFNAVYNNIDEPFSPEEIQKLENSLNLQASELELMLDTLIFIAKRCKNFLLKPTVLQEDLTGKLHFTYDKAEMFVKNWTEHTNMHFDNLSERLKIESFSWELNVGTCSDFDRKQVIPTSLLQLQVKDNKNEIKDIIMEMSEMQLLDLYNEIETIQSTLDEINKI